MPSNSALDPRTASGARAGLVRAGSVGGVVIGIVCIVGSMGELASPLHPALGARLPAAVFALLAAAALCGAPRLAGARALVGRALFESSPRAFEGVLFATAVLAYGVLSHRLFQAVPHMDDSIATVFQARILLAGQVTLPLPELAPFFETFGVLSSNQGLAHWCGMYPPGWPVLLMPGVALGAAWLTNPVLGGALVVMTGRLGALLFDGRTGRFAALLCLASPFVAVQGASHLSHVPTALAVVITWWSVLRMLDGGGARFGFLAGGALGVAFLCRPVTAVLLGVIIALGVLPRWREAFAAWRGVLAALSMVALACVVLAAWQLETTGDYRLAGHTVGMGIRGRVGFGQFDPRLEHTVARGIEHTFLRFANLNHQLLGWPVLAAPFVGMTFLMGRARWREIWLLLPVLALAGFFLCFWYFEVYYPGRYLFAALPMLLILVARGGGMFQEWAEARGPRIASAPTVLYGSFVLWGLVVGAPSHFASIDGMHGDVESLLPGIVEDYGIEQAIVFMESSGRRAGHRDDRNGYYGTGFQRNTLELDGDVIYARNLQQFGRHRLHNSDLMRLHPDRRSYFYRFDRGAMAAYLYEMAFEADGAVRLTGVKPHAGDDRLLYDPVVHFSR